MPRKKSRAGQAGIFIVLNLTIIFGTLGFAVDLGWAYYTKQAAQAAADSAALAAVAYASSTSAPVCGSSGVTCNHTGAFCSNPATSPATTDFQAGCLYAQTNGFVNNGTSQIVSMAGDLSSNNAPPGVTGNTPYYWVQANVTAKPFTLFGRFGGMSQLTINASAVAGLTYYSQGACIYAVGSGNISQEFSVTGAATVTATCGIFVNSTNTTEAFYTHGSPTITATQIQVNGTALVCGSCSVSPTPTSNAGSQPDPLASYTEPSLSSNVCPSPPYSALSYAGTTVASIPSGTYCGGISISHSANITFTGGNYTIYGGIEIAGNSTVTFDAGTYIINGQDSNGYSFDIGNGVTVSGSGVTFFNTGVYGQTIGPVTMGGDATVNLSAPTSGTYQGMLFLSDRTLSYATANSFANSATGDLQGTLYFPTSPVSYTGASTTGTYTALIGKTVTIAGSAAFKNDPTGQYTGLATTIRSLIQ